MVVDEKTEIIVGGDIKVTCLLISLEVESRGYESRKGWESQERHLYYQYVESEILEVLSAGIPDLRFRPLYKALCPLVDFKYSDGSTGSRNEDEPEAMLLAMIHGQHSGI